VIKARGDGIILFGLARANVERLIAGKPIVFEGALVGVPHAQILIMFGETERAIAEELVTSGRLPPTLLAAMSTILGPDWETAPSGTSVEAHMVEREPKEPS
jgi:hypothetical protein